MKLMKIVYKRKQIGCESQRLLFKEAFVYGICTVIFDTQSPITFLGSVLRG